MVGDQMWDPLGQKMGLSSAGSQDISLHGLASLLSEVMRSLCD